MGLYPPWKHTYISDGSLSEHPAGYGFISSPPARERSNHRAGIELDAMRLLVQWGCVFAVVSVGLLVGTNKERQDHGGGKENVLPSPLSAKGEWPSAQQVGIQGRRSPLKAVREHDKRLGKSMALLPLAFALAVGRDGVPGILGAFIALYLIAFLASFALCSGSTRAAQWIFGVVVVLNSLSILLTRGA